MTRWLALVCLLALPARAETLFRADFQDGRTSGWGAAGSGDVRLTTYNGNVSMRLTGGAAALARVPVSGQRGLYVRLKIAAEGLGDADRCVGEVAIDRGAWQPVLTIGRARADVVTLWEGSLALPGTGDALSVRRAARPRIAGSTISRSRACASRPRPARASRSAAPRSKQGRCPTRSISPSSPPPPMRSHPMRSPRRRGSRAR